MKQTTQTTQASFPGTCDPMLEFIYAQYVVKNKKKLRLALHRYGWNRSAITAYFQEYEKKYRAHRAYLEKIKKIKAPPLAKQNHG